MSYAQHTPGPWERDDGYIVSLHNHEKIATVHDWTTEDEDIDRAKANARLIAAAPDILFALSWCADVIAARKPSLDSNAGCALLAACKAMRSAGLDVQSPFPSETEAA